MADNYIISKPESLVTKIFRLFKTLIKVIFVLYFVPKVVKNYLLKKKLLKYYNAPIEDFNYLIGHLTLFKKFGAFTDEFFHQLHKRSSSNSSLTSFWIFNRMQISINESALIFDVYKHCNHRPSHEATMVLESLLGKENLVFKNDNTVAELRARLQRSVCNRLILEKTHNNMVSTIVSETVNWGNGPVDVHEELKYFLYDTFGMVLVGKDEWKKIGNPIRKLHQQLVEEGSKWIIYPIKPIWKSEYREFVKSCKKLHKIVQNLVINRRKQLRENFDLWKNDPSALTNIAMVEDSKGDKKYFNTSFAASSLIGLLHVNL